MLKDYITILRSSRTVEDDVNASLYLILLAETIQFVSTTISRESRSHPKLTSVYKSCVMKKIIRGLNRNEIDSVF